VKKNEILVFQHFLIFLYRIQVHPNTSTTFGITTSCYRMQKESINTSSSDLLLLSKLQSGNTKAFDLIFRKYYDNLCRFAFSIIHDADMSQSLVQNVFLRIWDRRFVLGHIDNLPGYLTTMVKNQISDYLKDRKNLSLVLKRYPGNPDSNTTEQDVFSKNFEECLIIALAKLPPRCRQAFELSRFENRSNKEIALEMKITVKGVEALIGRSLKVLRGELREFLPSFDLKTIDPILFFLLLSKDRFRFNERQAYLGA